jgi:TPR repeat protein
VACVAQMLGEACTVGDARACAFVGRMWIDGRGVARDVERGLEMLVRACDGGVALACVVGVRWLSEPLHARDLPDASDLGARFEVQHGCLTGEPQACFQLGVGLYFGHQGFPRDRARAALAYERGCDFGAAIACNNLGDALAHGDGVARDVVRSASMYDKACRLGEPMGCANFGYMIEHGEGVIRDRARARQLDRDACVSGEVYGCFHAEMLAAQDAGAPRDSQGAFNHWRRACARADARACAFVGIIYEDGPDGLARDADKSLEAMRRACGLGDERACEWVKLHPES